MLEGMEPPSNSRTCKVRRILADLEPKDQKILEDALADHMRWSSQSLTGALRSRGIMISVHPILAHRKGICRCSTT